MTLHWGIAGASKMAHAFCAALESNEAKKEHRIIAVASEDADCPKAARMYSGFEELSADSDVEAVFVTTATVDHFRVCKALVQAGKHVLCESPLGMNASQVRDILKLAELKNVLVLEAIWSRGFPAIRYMSKILQADGLGRVCEVYVKHLVNDSSARKDGISFDLAAHAVQFALFVFGEAPVKVKALGKVDRKGVDLYLEAAMSFSGGRTAKVVCSAMDGDHSQATIISRKGVVCIPASTCPTTLILPNSSIRTWPLLDPQSDEYGLLYLVTEVKKCIRSGRLRSDMLTPKEMLTIAQIGDEIRRQINVRYENDWWKAIW